MTELAGLSLYEAILSASEQMLLLAKAGEWDTLIEVEHARSQIIHELKKEKAGQFTDVVLEQKRLVMVGRIISLDEETQVLSQNWMNELSELIGSLGVEKKLNNAYDIR